MTGGTISPGVDVGKVGSGIRQDRARSCAKNPSSSQHLARWLLSPFYRGSERLNGLTTNHSQGVVAKGRVTPFLLHHTPQPFTGRLAMFNTFSQVGRDKDGGKERWQRQDACA